MALFAESKIRKQEGVNMPLHEGNCKKCLKICEFLSLIVCSLILVDTVLFFLENIFTSILIKHLHDIMP